MAHSITKQLLFASFALVSFSAYADLQNQEISQISLNQKIEVVDPAQYKGTLASITNMLKKGWIFAGPHNQVNMVELYFSLHKDKNVQKVAQIDGNAVGIIIASTNGFINILVVDPKFKKHEIAAKLLTTMQEVAQKNNVSSLSISADKHNNSAINLYKAFGFIESGIGYDFGTYAIHLSKKL